MAIDYHTFAKVARDIGLAPGTPVTNGSIDAAAEAIGVGVQNPRDMMIIHGSTIFIIQNTDRRLTESRLWQTPRLFTGQ